jgi:hypothetical protein
VDWTVPVRAIAAQLRVSRQRVYQVMAERGVPRRRGDTKKSQLLRLDTTRLTVAEAAARVGCTVNHAWNVLRTAGRRARRATSLQDPRYAAFAAWLAQHDTLANSTIQTLCTRCRRVERAHGVCLDRVVARPGGLARLCQWVAAEPARSQRDHPRALYNDRLALRRYAEFLGERGSRRRGPRVRTTGD